MINLYVYILSKRCDDHVPFKLVNYRHNSIKSLFGEPIDMEIIELGGKLL